MLQKNANPKSNHGKGEPAPSGAFHLTVSARMVKSFLVRKVARLPQILLPLPPWQDLFACDRLTAIDLFVRHQRRLAMPAHHPRMICGWCEKTLASKLLLSRPRWMLCATLLLSSRRQQPTWRKSLAIWQVRQRQPVRATQAALAAILARLEVKPVVPQVVVADNDYPPLPPTGATSQTQDYGYQAKL
ncbi:hypothetical protein BASA81_012026 [Batrachochytrium salamandrivorans]|nr:hypothetical protein BASA81_012026 [Batrachochytrium salamandrivorans]